MISPLLVLESHSRGRVETGGEDRERARNENLLATCELGSAKRVLLPSIQCNHSILTDVIVGRVDDLSPGACVSFELPDGNELAVFNVGGEFYATDNSCPHRGAPLSQGALCGHVIECWLHGWQFDVRSGECLTVPDRIRTYRVTIEDQMIKVHLTAD